MKQVKQAYKKCKEKLPNRPLDEIDFGLGFRAALVWVLADVKETYNDDLSNSEFVKHIEEELQ